MKSQKQDATIQIRTNKKAKSQLEGIADKTCRSVKGVIAYAIKQLFPDIDL